MVSEYFVPQDFNKPYLLHLIPELLVGTYVATSSTLAQGSLFPIQPYQSQNWLLAECTLQESDYALHREFLDEYLSHQHTAD